MRRAGSVLVAAIAAAGAACAGPRASQAPPAPPAQADASHDANPMGAMGMERHCPMAVPGTQVVADDTPDGEAITFTTSSDRVAELRSRVHAMAELHNRRMQAGGMGSTGSGSASAEQGPMQLPRPEMPPPSRATVEDVDGGARVVVTPNDPSDAGQLRTVLRVHAEHMRDTGTCGMGADAAYRM